MRTFKNLTELSQAAGYSLPPSNWVTVTQAMIDLFADATGDHQWIHTDPERAAKESPLGSTIAHGFMSLSLMPKWLEEAIAVESAQVGMNYGLDSVRFPHPVPVNARLRLHAKMQRVVPQAPNGVKIFWDCTIEIEGVAKPACVAVFITVLFE